MDLAAATKVKEFYSAYPIRKWSTKQILIHPDDKPPGVYYLESGGIRQYTIDYRGEEIVVNVFYPPAFLPMLYAFNNQPSKYFFEATEPTITRLAPTDEILQFIKSNPDVSYDLLSRLYSGIDGVLMRTVHLMSGTAYTRLLNELIIQSQRLHPGEKDAVILPLKEYQIGSYCGLSRETVSREFKKLKARNLAQVDKKGIAIPSLNRLQIELQKHTE